ncbi:MAG TPA: hypothetical protein VNR36_11900 [Pseudolysinimonas sp.]|nr:hypothetical protein [Pseudolysinimonas sp.]
MQRRAALHLIGFGILAGVAWAASLRGYMAELAGPSSHVDALDTFALILLPGAVVGALLGAAESVRRRGGRRGWRWTALAPLLFPVLALLPPGAFLAFITTGIGGGAVAIAANGMLGGYAISGRGPLWSRLLAGALSAALLIAGVFAGPIVNPALALTTPRGAWVAVLGLALGLLLVLACSIPHRRIVQAHPWAG